MRKPSSPNAIDYSGFKFPKGVHRVETGKDTDALRFAVFIRDKGICQVCGKKLKYKTQWAGHPDRYHMAHRQNKRMYGDSPSNLRALCGDCHRAEHGNKLPKGFKTIIRLDTGETVREERMSGRELQDNLFTE